MIYDAMRSLQATFTARKFPTYFEYGPRRIAVEAYCDHLVVIERDHDGSDTLAAANGVQTNPRRICNRAMAAKATIYAKSNLDGARINEHEAECEQIVDALIIALQEWGSAAKARLGDVVPTIQEMRYLKPSEFIAAEGWPGVAFMVRFKAHRGVIVRDYENAARPTGAATSVGGEVHVRLNADDPPEVLPLP